QQYESRVSFEEPFEEIGIEAPSIMDEQPVFLDEIKAQPPPPRMYGSPAANRFVNSRLVKSPTAKKLRAPSQLTGSRGVQGGMAAHADAQDGMAAHADAQDGTRLPTFGRSNSVSFEGAPNGEQPLSPGLDAVRLGGPTRSRGNTYSGERAYRDESTSSAVPCSSDSNNSPEEANADDVNADDINDLVAPFGGLRIGDVDSLVKQHRAEIRATTEACKEETMLISAYTAFSYAQLVQQSRNKMRGDGGHPRPSSWQQQAQGLADKYHLDASTGVVTRLGDGERFDSVEKAKMSEAIEYLEKLDEVLARKQQLIVDLREGIRKLVWGEGISE
ncbi:hypothetical protein GGF43_004981, partial [Coemansia sp. RSA 2618]